MKNGKIFGWQWDFPLLFLAIWGTPIMSSTLNSLEQHSNGIFDLYRTVQSQMNGQIHAGESVINFSEAPNLGVLD